MRRRTAVLPLAVLALSCVAPSEQSGELRVVMEPIPPLFAAETTQAVARVVDPGGVEVHGVAIAFGTSDAAVASVSPAGLVAAIGPGTVTVLAWAPGLENAALARTVTSVRSTVEIDSVLPRRVKYGSQLQLYGVGLDPVGAAAVTTGGVAAPIGSYTPADPAHPERDGVLRVFAVPPLGENSDEVNATEVPITVATSRGTANLSTPLIIEPRDIYEPNDSVATELGVITGRFEATGLAFDKLDSSKASLPVDWYTFTTATRGDWTISVRGADAWQAFPSADLVEETLAYTGVSLDGFSLGEWYVDRPTLRVLGTDGSCNGFAGALVPPLDLQNPGVYLYGPGWTANKQQMRWALEDLPAGTHHLLIGSLFGWPLAPGTSAIDGIFRSSLEAGIGNRSFAPIRYDLIIEPGIHTDVPPDRFEGNDFCEDAPTVLSLGPAGFADSVVDGLTIDAEFDYDWFVVEAQTPGRLYLTVESDNQDRKQNPLLLSPTPGVGQPVTRMDLEGFGNFGEGQELLSSRDFATGVPLEARPYYLVIQSGPPRYYRLRFSWVPGAPPPATLRSPGVASTQLGQRRAPERKRGWPGR